jgi:hypothetical protein
MFKTGCVQPKDVQLFINSVLGASYEDLAGVLRTFTWTFGKVGFTRLGRIALLRTVVIIEMLQGDFFHWVAVFNHFDTFFETYTTPRLDVLLKFDGTTSDPPFPREQCLEILRVSGILLENCMNKQVYQSMEVSTSIHLKCITFSCTVALTTSCFCAALVRSAFCPM